MSGPLSCRRTVFVENTLDGAQESKMEEILVNFTESPVLYRSTKKLEHIQRSDQLKVNLEEIHKRLSMYLNRKCEISREELKLYLNQINNFNPENSKNRWFLMKISGLLKYILKRRSDFQCCIVNGEISISDRSISQHEMVTSAIPEPPLFCSQPNSVSFDFPKEMLTNDNFLTIESERNPNCSMDCDINYSEDLFPSLQSLHAFSQENYKLLKQITSENHNDIKVTQEINAKIDQAHNMHEVLEEDCSSFLALQPSVSECSTPDGLDNKFETNLSFDNNQDKLITNEELKTTFDKFYSETEEWVNDIVQKLSNLDVSDKIKSNESFSKENKTLLNESMSSSSSLHLKTYHSEENMKIIREVCLEFRKNLEKKIENNKNLEIVKELLQSANFS